MLGTLRRLAASVARAFRSTPPPPAPTPAARALAAIALRDALGYDHFSFVNHYPFRTSRRKTQGQRDASLKSRANRRKAAR